MKIDLRLIFDVVKDASHPLRLQLPMNRTAKCEQYTICSDYFTLLPNIFLAGSGAFHPAWYTPVHENFPGRLAAFVR